MDSLAAGRVVDHRAQVTALTGLFVDALAGADPAARLPSSGTWTVADLAAHLGGVHRWVAEIVRTGRRAHRENRPAVDGDPVDFYRAAREALLAAFAETDPERACWALRTPDRRAGFWHRRQTHETLVHLWDLRAAADAAATLDDVDPAVCADGVDELLEVFLRRASPADLRPLASPVRLVAVDAGRSWTVGPQWTVGDGPGGVEVRAAAGELLLWAWRRPCGRPPVVEGNPDAVTAFRRSRFVP